MRLSERPWRARPHQALWRFARGGTEGVEVRWFCRRFLDAATVVAARWAPSPLARRSLLGRPAAAWLLVLLWAAVPLWLLVAVARDLHAVGGP